MKYAKTEPICLGDQIDCIPSIHGRAAFAQEVRRFYLAQKYDCIAVELPLSLKDGVLEGVTHLPYITAYVYPEGVNRFCYVPIVPSDSIIEGIRLAISERVPVEFIDYDSPTFETEDLFLPDEYGVPLVGLKTYYEQIKPLLPIPPSGSLSDLRNRFMACQLRELSLFYKKILFICGIGHLPAIEKYFYQPSLESPPKDFPKRNGNLYSLHPDHLYFLMGELPYLTYLYEKARQSWNLEEFDKTDGIKELLLDSRKNYIQEFPEEEDLLTVGQLQTLITFLRNLSLINGRLTPSLYHLIVAAKGTGGGRFALEVAEMAKYYPFMDIENKYPQMKMGIQEGELPGIGLVHLKNRLPGPPIVWKNIKIERKPPKHKKKKWKRHFNPWGQCSWPEEDEVIENFMAHVRKRANSLLQEDQKKVEKFSSSLKDGIDIRETLRNWHQGDIYVKELPPSRGEVGAVIMIFEKDKENKYPWCSTWQAEHQNESTISFYATDFHEDMVGPQIGRAYYGGVMFIYPPKYLPDIWTDERFAKWKAKDEKLVVASCVYSDQKAIAYVGAAPPSPRLKRFAKSLGKRIIYLPLTTFSSHTLRKIRKFHVLGGKFVRSYARDYIR
ncbi:MAG: hypothetical protein D6785_09025 [Planctomycetota bacterium]|nr:MAG: hypothetical protein D6785_09025 [Planctomycetota bacterium]